MDQEFTKETKGIIDRAAAGSAEAFRSIYDHLIDKVYAYVRYRTASEDDALDLTQEIFVDLYKALPTFTYASQPQFYGFVFTIIKRKLAKYYAHAHTKAARVTTSFDEESHTGVEEYRSDTTMVVEALDTLDEVAREIVVLHHWSRYTFPEIAALIDMTESAVRVRHHRALKTLSASLETS